jgi:hypothetical protein
VIPHLSNLYHWSPAKARTGILRRGLLPRTPTSVAMHPVPDNLGHHMSDDDLETHLAVCLGTTPGAAWALSGAWSGERGEPWDLWEVSLCDEDEVHIRCEYGAELWEVRVLGPVPKGRLWFAGTRVVPQRGSRWHARPEG